MTRAIFKFGIIINNPNLVPARAIPFTVIRVRVIPSYVNI